MTSSTLVVMFLLLKKFGYLSVITVLSALRLLVGKGSLTRILAFMSLIIALVGLAAFTLPEIFGVYKGWIYVNAWKIRTAAGGFAVLMLASTPLILSAWAPGRRWIALDIFHAWLVVTTLGLWALVGR